MRVLGQLHATYGKSDQFPKNNAGYFQFVLTPVNHWSRRGLFDGDKALWGGWAVIGADGVSKFWHGGDTAYCDAFAQIGKVGTKRPMALW